jgi:hypothetical protein
MQQQSGLAIDASGDVPITGRALQAAANVLT